MVNEAYLARVVTYRRDLLIKEIFVFLIALCNGNVIALMVEIEKGGS